MNSVSDKILSIPTLGRPFSLGMLYDCRNDQLIQGITLWAKSALEEKAIQHLETSEFHIITTDSLKDKASALDINANLKLSFLGDLLDVSGSGKYLHNVRSSNQRERVTLQFKCTTKMEEITMEQLSHSKVQHPEAFNCGIATHVITGILYGAQAFFVFERDCSSSLNDELHGNLHSMVKLIPKMEIDCEGQIKISEHEKKKVENINCSFTGDILLRENPYSYLDAVHVYKELPCLIREKGQHAVPIRVTLYPLTLLDSKASKLVHDISANLTSETEKIFQDLHDLNVRCNDLCNSSSVKKVYALEKEISEFKSLITTYKCELQTQLSVLLPSIKGGGAEESHLADIFRNKETSPFSQYELLAWVNDKEKLVKILNAYTETFSEIKFASQPGDLESMILSPENDYTLCFNILRPKDNSHLSKMKMYIRNQYDSENASTSAERNPEETLMRNDGEMSMVEKAILFRNFFNSNKGKSRTAFVVAVNFSDTLHYQAYIQCYKHGRIVNKNYEVPSAPGMPQTDRRENTHNSITIVWTPPEYGTSTLRNYEILCQQVNTNNPTVNLITDLDTCSFTIPNLQANCVYQMSVRSQSEVGVGPTSEVNIVSTTPSSTPGKPQVWQISPTTVEIQWSEPLYTGPDCCIQHYILKQQEEGTELWNIIATTKADELIYRTEITQNTVPKFKVAADCGVAGCSVDSDPNDHISYKTDDMAIKDENSENLKINNENGENLKIKDENGENLKTKDENGENLKIKDENGENLKIKLCAASKLVHESIPYIYELNPKLVFSNDQDFLRKYELGTPNQNTQEKVILLIGATGSGKTTWINGLINHIFGVNWKDDFRFKLISEFTDGNQAKSQTQHITSYTIYHEEGFNYPNTLSVIDTPGFGDTSGVMRDREITSQMHKFFTTNGIGGIDHIDAVGFVVQSSLPRLTPTQSYIFDQILSLFGKDIKENVFLLLTFADGQKPQVLSGIKEAGMPYQKHFKFNNSALYANITENDVNIATEEENTNFDEMFWQMGVNSFKEFLKQLNIVESKSLLLTQDVLNERNQLQNYITGIQVEIQVGLNKLEILKKEEVVVRSHQADIDKNKNFTYTVNEEISKQVEIPPGQYITNCQKCNRTCHEVCLISDDEQKHKCWAVKDDHCRICPEKCHWSMHKNFPFKYVLEIVKKTKTADDLRARYEKATKEKLSAENLISKIQDEFLEVQLKVLGMTDSVRKSLDRLQEIALKPNPLSTVEYIDILIESEKSQAHPGWMARVEQLRNIRKEAEYMQKISDQGFDPFKDYIKNLKTNKNPKDVTAELEKMRKMLEYHKNIVDQGSDAFIYHSENKIDKRATNMGVLASAKRYLSNIFR